MNPWGNSFFSEHILIPFTLLRNWGLKTHNLRLSGCSCMSWTLSRFRTGDLQVRSREEILATFVNCNGRVGGMPFMPEMLQFCGQRHRVGAVAHKTCDTLTQSRGLRLQSMVHLAAFAVMGRPTAGARPRATCSGKTCG